MSGRSSKSFFFSLLLGFQKKKKEKSRCQTVTFDLTGSQSETLQHQQRAVARKEEVCSERALSLTKAGSGADRATVVGEG